jgi:hypothetical protein
MPFAVAPVSQQIQAIQSENRAAGLDRGRQQVVGRDRRRIVLLIFLRMLSKQKPEPVPVEVLSDAAGPWRPARCRTATPSPRHAEPAHPAETRQHRRRACATGSPRPPPRTDPRLSPPPMADIDYSKLSRQQKLAVFLICIGPRPRPRC